MSPEMATQPNLETLVELVAVSSIAVCVSQPSVVPDEGIAVGARVFGAFQPRPGVSLYRHGSLPKVGYDVSSSSVSLATSPYAPSSVMWKAYPRYDYR